MRKPFAAPTLEPLGTITEMTGTWGDGDIDGCFELGEKGIGYPSDQTWKFIPICEGDKDGNSVVS